MANKQEDRQVFRLLLAHGSNPNVISDYGYPMAYICLRQKQYVWFDLLVAAGADLNYVSPTGRSMLDYAFRQNHSKTVALLRKRGIPMLRISRGPNLLNSASKRGDVQAVVERLRAGDDPYLRDQYKLNALETAARAGSFNCAAALLEAGVDPDVAFGKPLKAAVVKGDKNLVDLLLEHGARPDVRRNRVHKTALHDAACRSPSIVKNLVARGADVNATHWGEGKTPLWWAVNCGNAEARAFLEARGGRYRIDDGWYRMATPFEKAAADGDIQKMTTMILQGHDLNERDAFGDTAFHFAAAGQVEAMEFLEARGGLPMFRGGQIRTPLFWAAFHGHIDACRYLMKKGCRVKDADAAGEKPLHFAAKGNRVDVVTLFLDIGADVNANAKKKSPLMAAAGSNAAEAAKLLIERGAVVDARGNSGRSALHAAAINGSADGARVLLEHGADIHAGDEQGITPFQFASAYRHRHGSNRLYRLMMTASGRPVKAGFDCDQADGAVEELVCADLDLAAMDAEMHRYYRKLEDSLVGQAGEKLRAYQQRWLKEDRNACVFSRGHYPQEEAFHEARNCLKAAYNERVESLKMSLAAHGFSLPGSSKP